ncbi:hypothetical protein IFM89_020705 [Coptis chinensis]|uniref:Uncharacterized protein n=1 Tax=Coptis chinensis TaxID=261450 RepID=A0A835H4B1_9MAGN|nr:hypothetical protein IFM89_020705 [Coptis chinensis]
MRHKLQTEEEEEDVLEAPKFTLTPTPPKKKRVTFQGSVGVSSTRSAMSMVAKSVPDFSATLRKENRKPMEMNTPPSSLKNSSSSSKMSKLRGSKSAGGGDKGCGGIVRKSYASIEDLKGLGSSVSSAINGEGKGVGRSFRGIQKTVLGYRQY